MYYGFNLGQLEGLDSSIAEIGYYIVVGDSTRQGNMHYSGNETWRGTSIQLYNTPDGYCLLVETLTASDVGKTATITLQSNEDVPTSDFKSAVKESIEPVRIYMPAIVFEKVQLALGQNATNVISNAGKICTVPDISINKNEYVDANDQATFKSFSIAVANAATLNKETSVYIGDALVTGRLEIRSGNSIIGGSIIYSQDITMNKMKFKAFVKIAGFYHGDTVTIEFDAVYPVVLS